jgi:hypothetical protein
VKGDLSRFVTVGYQAMATDDSASKVDQKQEAGLRLEMHGRVGKESWNGRRERFLCPLPATPSWLRSPLAPGSPFVTGMSFFCVWVN